MQKYSVVGAMQKGLFISLAILLVFATIFWSLAKIGSYLNDFNPNCPKEFEENSKKLENIIIDLATQVKRTEKGISKKFEEIVPFNWQQMCVIPPFTSASQMDHTLGFQWQCSKEWQQISVMENYYILLFKVDKKIIPVRLDRRNADLFHYLPKCYSYNNEIMLAFTFQSTSWGDVTAKIKNSNEEK